MVEQVARTIERNMCRIEGWKTKGKRLFGNNRYGESNIQNNLKKIWLVSRNVYQWQRRT